MRPHLPLLAFAGVGFASWAAWPPGWRLGLCLGWGSVLSVEVLLLGLRLRALARSSQVGNRWLGLSVAGFLLKLLLVLAGGSLGAWSGWYHVPSFLLSFVVGLLVGETVSVTVLLRATRLRVSNPEVGGAGDSA